MIWYLLIPLSCYPLYSYVSKPFSNIMANRILQSKLHKIESIVEHFNNVMDLVYNPAKGLVIHESLVPWRGRINFQQYIKIKK